MPSFSTLLTYDGKIPLGTDVSLCQYSIEAFWMKQKEFRLNFNPALTNFKGLTNSIWDHEIVSIIGEIPLVAGPLE